MHRSAAYVVLIRERHREPSLRMDTCRDDIAPKDTKRAANMAAAVTSFSLEHRDVVACCSNVRPYVVRTV
jgi:hypothetical protein